MCVRIACVQASSPTPSDEGLDLCISHFHPFGYLVGSRASNYIVNIGQLVIPVMGLPLWHLGINIALQCCTKCNPSA